MSTEVTAKEQREGIQSSPRKDKGRKDVAKKAAKLERLVVEYVAADSIKPNSYNPNRQSEHDFELLLRSMEEDGFTQPIVVHRETRTIVDGEHRWRAAQKLGFADVPVVFTDMTPEQMRIATLRHNRARGSEDVELSAQVLRDLRELGALDWAQDSLMLDDVELQKLLDDVPVPDALASEAYSPAWEPTKADNLGATDAKDASATPAAQEALNKMTAAVNAAKTEEDKVQARKDADIFRIVCVFAGDEAKVVREVLGASPASRLLEMCKAAAAPKPA